MGLPEFRRLPAVQRERLRGNAPLRSPSGGGAGNLGDKFLGHNYRQGRGSDLGGIEEGEAVPRGEAAAVGKIRGGD